MSQQIAWQVSLVLMTLVGFGFTYVAINSDNRIEEYAQLQKKAYRVRSRLFWILALVLGPAMIFTLVDLPYAASHAHSSGVNALSIEAKAYQWRWELSSNRIAVGQPVEFRVSSADINHGFAIYDPDMHLVAQTQAMPGYTNKLRHTFDKEGTYRILCLEYCGIAHHNMMTEIVVAKL
ncbi:MAG: cytochrome C oxidase subunit II [Sulfuritalea sp.]|nr:cytochrome C oxidase subunit II [Sulfuritalea sp.]